MVKPPSADAPCPHNSLAFETVNVMPSTSAVSLPMPPFQRTRCKDCGAIKLATGEWRQPPSADATAGERDLRSAALECAEDLEALIRNTYGYPDVHPAQQYKFDRDMEVVLRVRAAASSAPTEWVTPELLAQRFHEAYERIAPAYGYKTREASAKPWCDVPEDNKRLMIATAREVMGILASSAPTEARDSERLDWLLRQLRTWPGGTYTTHVEAWLPGFISIGSPLTRADVDAAMDACRARAARHDG